MTLSHTLSPLISHIYFLFIFWSYDLLSMFRNQMVLREMMTHRQTKRGRQSWSCWRGSWRKKTGSSRTRRSSLPPKTLSLRPRSRSYPSRKRPSRLCRRSWRETPIWLHSFRRNRKRRAPLQRLVAYLVFHDIFLGNLFSLFFYYFNIWFIKEKKNHAEI